MRATLCGFRFTPESSHPYENKHTLGNMAAVLGLGKIAAGSVGRQVLWVYPLPPISPGSLGFWSAPRMSTQKGEAQGGTEVQGHFLLTG